MKMTPGELSVINYTLQIGSDGMAKQYALPELILATEIYKEVKKRIKDNIFIEGEIDLTSEHKVFLLSEIDKRKWGIQDAESVFSLKKKIA